MAQVNNLKIITEFGELVYRDALALNITFNRIVDDFQDLSNRFGDFSYDFELPLVKENSIVFGYANALGQKRIFPKNRNISCSVYLNNSLLLDGLINLEAITRTGYKCTFYSKFKQLVDSLNEIDPETNEEKTLRSLKFPVIEKWQYEKTMVQHMLTEGVTGDSDTTIYQHGLCFYSTYYCQESYYSGLTDINSASFRQDWERQNYYYLLNNLGGKNNRMYIHQFPPQIYLVRIIKQILEDAGWKIGGQFFKNKDIKRIVLTYAGDEDIYDQATEKVSGSTALNLQLAKFLPDMKQTDFLKSVMNYFNLYFKVDVNNRIIEFETYDTYFTNMLADAYDITNKVVLNTVEFSYVENNDPSIVFAKPQNKNIMGDNYFMSGYSENAYTQKWISGSNKTFNQVFNRVGTTDEIKIDFSAPTVKKHYIYNNVDITGTDNAARMHILYLPLLSKQTRNDNNNMKFNKKSTDTYLYNNEASIKFQGDGSLMYYYGNSNTDFENKTGKGSLANYLFTNIYSGGTLVRVPIGILSPFQLSNARNAIQNWQNNISVANYSDRRTSISTYLQTIWHMLGSSTGVTDSLSTEFSLVFDDNGYFHKTLWSKFHKNKWDRYKNSELMTASMRMNAFDWQEMQIDRPILYNQELYSIVSIEGYNPLARTASIKLIKKL